MDNSHESPKSAEKSGVLRKNFLVFLVSSQKYILVGVIICLGSLLLCGSGFLMGRMIQIAQYQSVLEKVSEINPCYP